DSVLRTLLRLGLIEDVGRAPTVGRPILYSTTFEFLQHFGLQELDDLPPLDESPTGEEG
ncbi:MAG: SMC-Scp complex subunit ScpB, partial [Anaerolineae bacterium]